MLEVCDYLAGGVITGVCVCVSERVGERERDHWWECVIIL